MACCCDHGFILGGGPGNWDPVHAELPGGVTSTGGVLGEL